METAILAIVVIGFIALGWLIRSETKRIMIETRSNAHVAGQIAQDCWDHIESVADVLKEASRIKIARTDSVFDKGDTIPVKARYVPLAFRRRQAEQQSAGPATHDQKVRENNARAMETI
jgi:hypothetical protein